MCGLANTSCTRKLVCPDSPIRLHQLLNSQTSTKTLRPQTKTTSPCALVFLGSRTMKRKPWPKVASKERNTGSEVLGWEVVPLTVQVIFFVEVVLWKNAQKKTHVVTYYIDMYDMYITDMNIMCILNIIMYIICLHMYNMSKRWHLHGFVPFLETDFNEVLQDTTRQARPTRPPVILPLTQGTEVGRDWHI